MSPLFYIVLALMVGFFALSIYMMKTHAGLRHKHALAVFSLFLSIACAIALLFIADVFGLRKSKGPDIHLNDYEAARAYTVGRYIAQTWPGSKLILVGALTLDGSKGLNEVYEAALKKGLGPDASIVAVEYIKKKKNKKGREVLDINNKDFSKLVRKYPECDMLVTTTGFPWGIDKTHLWKDAETGSIILIILNGDIRPFRSAIKAGIISAAISYRPWWTFDPKFPEDPFEKFKQRYILITKDNADELWRRYKRRLFWN